VRSLLEPPLTVRDFMKAVRSVKPTVSQEDTKRSEELTKELGGDG